MAQNETLTKHQTTLLNSGRLRIANSSQGDMWDLLQTEVTVGAISIAAYNSTVSGFNSLRSLIHNTITSGFTVTGTKENGDPQAIGDDADGPIILQLPTS